MTTLDIKTDCRHFNGYKPCQPHKQRGVHCDDCDSYAPTQGDILIIKLEAAGEVLRNTPLLAPIRRQFPRGRIFWLTSHPELIPRREVFRVVDFDLAGILLLQDIEFDLLLSLDKDLEACALANRLHAKVKKGFSQRSGVIVPFDDDSAPKWQTGVFDDLMKANTDHYLREIFDICGYEFQGEPYLLPEFTPPEVEGLDADKPLVLLNTGAGDKWKPRIYSEAQWVRLARDLLADGREVIIAGGPDEHDKNLRIAADAGARYPGVYSYVDFIGLLSLADVVVTSVTFALHAAIGLQKKVVALNNTFNRHEIHAYVETEILEPDVPCLMCYKQDFDQDCVRRHCMDMITPARIRRRVDGLLST
ncbi:MAG: glycosyltransferase family 9 protein [Deltaproteobacteria bacterium]|nr:glycosyltransferase family 9 protein [Deltaproteobacteria bacterium]